MSIVRLSFFLDHGTPNPLEDWDGMWTLISFGRDNTKEDYNNVSVRNKLRAGTAFELDLYRHGNTYWHIAGTPPYCRWDNSTKAGLLLWNHKVKDLGAKTVEDRRKDAVNCLNLYNDWANGNVYGYHLTDEDGELDDSCGGFIGSDSGMVESYIVPTLKDYIEKNDLRKVVFMTEEEYEEEEFFNSHVLYIVREEGITFNYEDKISALFEGCINQ